jgi:hypothetical protein
MQNPFVYYSTCADLAVYVQDIDVTAEVETRLQTIESTGKAGNLLVTGNGGAGKSCLFSYIEEKCREQQIFTLRWEFGEQAGILSPLEFFQTLEARIIERVREDYQVEGFRTPSIFRRFRAFVKSLDVGPLTLDVQDREQPQTVTFLYTKGRSHFRSLAEQVKEATNTKGILLLFDDADETTASVFQLFPRIFPDDGHYTIFIACGERLFTSGFSRDQLTKATYRLRLTRTYDILHIKPMTVGQIGEMLRKQLFKSLGTSFWFDDFHIQLIHEISDGNPFIAYRIAGLCFQHGLSGNQLRLTQYVVDKAIEQIWETSSTIEKKPHLLPIIRDRLEQR